MTELVATLSPDRMIGALDEELHRLKAICSEIEHDLMSSPIRLRFSGQSATRKASRPSSIMVTITEVDDDQGIHERNDPTNNETSEMLVSTDLPIQEQSIQEQTIQEPDDDDDDDDVYDGLFTIRLFDDDDDEVQMPQPQMIPALEVTIDCSICWATTPSFATLPCGHLFCKPCLDDLVRVASTNSFGEMPVVVCPQVDCGVKIEHSHQIRQITSPVTFLTYTYFQMRAEAKAYSGLHNCHNPALQCEGVLLPSDFSTDLKVSCRLCTTVHCSVCFLPDHPDLSCQEASRIQRKRAKTNSVEYQRRKQRRARLRGGIKAIIPTIITQTLMTVHPAAKRCPGCFNWIFKNGGCHHMNCQHCRINFCWDCRSPYGGRPHCLLNGILFPVALPIAVATCAVYSASAILPVSLYLVGHRIKKAIQGRPYSFPGQVVGDACLMNYHIACRAANLQLGRYELLDYQPAPNPATVVVSADGMAAFTVLSERLIRMEYTATANVFETRPSVAFVNRYVAQALAVNVSSTAKTLTLETSALRVTYRLGAAFNADNLLVEGLRPGQGFTRWTPAMSNSNSGNLLGTVRSLDLAGVLPLNCTENADITVHHESLHCAWGLMGRQGFALVDDTASWMLSPEDYFWDGPNADAQDWYLFAHGQDYKGALQDFVGVAGRAAMPPRYAAGIMYTRWYNYDSLSLKHILNAFESRDLPLDVLILDMDWHEKSGWGAYSTDQRLFQYPADAYGWVRSQGVALALNLHDNNGVVYTENMYQAFADSLGFDTSQKATVPFSIVNSTWVFNLEDIVLGDLVDMGVNFWWIDWQQGGVAGGIPASSGQSQNPTIMLNHIRATDNMRRGSPERAMVLGRWGGLGNHRYQVGFSGDVLGPRSLPEFGLSWRNLAYQPYFTWTASNVGFGFWSHDLVGPRYDHELHTRWLQWGANSGVFRTHDRGMSSGYCAEVDEELCAVVRPWNVPLRFFEINRDCMRRRAEWLPYIYQQYRIAYDTGVSIVRPMYYESPDLPMAYAGDPTGAFSQYYFGEAMIVAPVVQHSSEGTQMATKSVWLPPGQWFELSTGLLFSGGPSAVLTKNYDLSEIPTFIRAGAVIPSLVLDASVSSLGAASRQYQHLRFSIYPGSDTGSFSLYEDDGATTAYVSPTATASTTVAYAYKRSNASSQLLITISTQGGYPELPSSRPYQIALPNVFPPSGVLLNGNSALSYARFPRAATSLSTGFWTYLGNEVSLLIQLPSLPISQPLQLAVEWNGAPDQASLGGLIGMLHHGMLAKENLDEVGVTPGTHTTAGGYLDLLVSSGDALTYLAGVNATQFHSHVGALTSTLFPRAVAEVNALHSYLEGSLLQLYSESRQDSLLCASAKCVNDNIKYYQIRIEAYLPSITDGSAPLVPLHVYWNPATQDHLATTLPPPSGFEKTGIPSASVLQSPANGTVPLSLWFHPIRRDHLTVASPAGLDFARMWGYALVNASIGYVLPQPPVSQAVPREYVPRSRLAYSMALLLSVFTTPTIG